MGNKEGKKTNTLIDQERLRNTQKADQAESYLLPERQNEKAFADSLRGDIVRGYQDFANGRVGTGVGGGGGGGMANISLDPIYGELEPRYRNLSTGIDESMGGYRQFANTGGITDENTSRIRGNGVFDEMARTGGVSDLDRANMRSRGIAPVGAFYSNLKNELARRNSVQGGYGAGYTSGASKLARDAAVSGSNAARDTELGISDLVRTGRMQGASALSGAESQLASQINQGKLAGLGGLENLGRFGYGGLEGIASAKMQVAAQNAAAGASRSAASAADDRYANQMKLAGLGGLESVYGSSPAELSRYDENLFTNRGMSAQQAGNNLGLRAEYNPNTSAWDKAMQLAGLGVGAATAFLPQSRKRPPVTQTYYT